MLGLCVGDREACADCQCGERIDPIAASAPVRKLLFVEALGHTRVPFAGYRPDHRAGVEARKSITPQTARLSPCRTTALSVQHENRANQKNRNPDPPRKARARAGDPRRGSLCYPPPAKRALRSVAAGDTVRKNPFMLGAANARDRDD